MTLRPARLEPAGHADAEANLDSAEPDTEPLICIVLVTYGSTDKFEAYLKKTVEFVRDSPRGEIELILVDNSEDSRDADRLSSIVPSRAMSVIRRPDNPGFAAACNLAALQATAKWLALVNPDVMLNRASMERVVEHVKAVGNRQTTFAVGQVTRGVRHQGIAMRGGVWFTDRQYRKADQLIGPSGGFGIYLRSIFVDAGGFDEKLFAWGEDAELALRLRRNGIVCTAIPEFFTHAGGHSHEGSVELTKRKAWLLARNRQIIAIEHYSLTKLLKFELYAVVRLIWVGITPRKRRLAPAYLKGNIAGFRHAKKKANRARL